MLGKKLFILLHVADRSTEEEFKLPWFFLCVCGVYPFCSKQCFVCCPFSTLQFTYTLICHTCLPLQNSVISDSCEGGSKVIGIFVWMVQHCSPFLTGCEFVKAVSGFNCRLCKTFIRCGNDVISHIKGKKHQKNYQVCRSEFELRFTVVMAVVAWFYFNSYRKS